ncbi:MAG: hypothetical protein NXI10_13120 [bacterium]|nr:hypothetical protein [bacterium]
MKKIIGLFALSFLVLTACGPSSRVSDPEDIADQVMDIIEDMDDMSKEDFRDEFMTFDEFQDLAEDEEVVTEKEARKRIKEMKESDRNEDLDKDFARIVERGSKHKIKWDEIEFVDFEYEVEKDRGMKACGGKVIFKSGSKKYSMSTVSIYDGSGYCLVSLRGPYESRD